MKTIRYIVYDKDGVILRTGFCPGEKNLYLMADPRKEEYVIEGLGNDLDNYVTEDFQVGHLVIPKPRPGSDWKSKRNKKYPSMKAFADAYVKLNSNDPVLEAEGQEQMDAYIALCLKVKADYPKTAE